MGRRRTRTTPVSWAAFAAQDVDEARAGRPSADLRAYAAERDLHFGGDRRQLRVLGGVPRWNEYIHNCCAGRLGDRRQGVVQHELLEIGFATSEHSGHRLAMGGDFAKVKLRGDLRLADLLPLAHLFSGVRDAPGPFPADTATVPVTAVVLHVPQAALLSRFTVRSADRLRNADGPPLDPHGLAGYRLRGRDAFEPAAWERLLPRAAGALGALAGPYVSFEAGTALVALRVGGFVADPGRLDALVAHALTLADAVADVVAPPPHPDTRFHLPLPPAPAEEPMQDADRWGATLDDAAAQWGLRREDPDALHRAYPALPVPGRSRGVLAGELPGGARGRLTFHQHRRGDLSLLAAALFERRPGAPELPPGGVNDDGSGMRVAAVGDLVACWSQTMDDGQLAVTATAERGRRAAASLGQLAG
ncbi:hypothetical protein [Paraconexibacter algicola]|uniref:Uncharacterized protein n=1 Tax=Paraconexibacter algicola TaxID=2133960 RepID=A0A2T4UBS7_9ACTN|nr:hypothetical protein [Paraconexibacter algicola]PTL54364.1 hypothetical protein C7Y72_21765 [Paraconexibacter algicola]